MKKTFFAIGTHVAVRGRQVVGFALVIAALSVQAKAAVTPEIDASSLLSGLTLLGCGLSILTHRSRKK